VEPDVFTSAKGLGGGIPIGAMMTKKSCNVLQAGEHASTFGGNPFACAVATAVCHTLEKENILDNVSQRGEQLRQGLRNIAAKYPEHIAEVRGWGLIDGMELQAEIELNAIDVVKAAMNEGLFLAPAGAKVVRFVPPLIVTQAEVDTALQIVDKVMTKVKG
ncbi:MAG: aminotransferase class III-fold pyridoxal phosphate-dependent enzyme, partial [Rivularia sp. ALOHA_DT_140]|nr:aminotransferase class III-fold pyridoxal phosphate-dependent enzyme [Rivularia sp. ALOHA_DT_140]